MESLAPIGSFNLVVERVFAMMKLLDQPPLTPECKYSLRNLNWESALQLHRRIRKEAKRLLEELNHFLEFAQKQFLEKNLSEDSLNLYHSTFPHNPQDNKEISYQIAGYIGPTFIGKLKDFQKIVNRTLAYLEMLIQKNQPYIETHQREQNFSTFLHTSHILPDFLRHVFDNAYSNVQIKPELARLWHIIFYTSVLPLIDVGANRRRCFDDKIADAVPGLNRSGLVIAAESLASNQNKDLKDILAESIIIVFDIADFRSLAMNLDNNHFSQADWMINKIMRELNYYMKTYNESCDNTGKIIVSRIGGDEFAIMMTGVSQENRQVQTQTILDKIKTIISSFNLRIKAIEEINLPQDDDDSEIFIKAFRRGLIMGTEDIALVKTGAMQNQPPRQERVQINPIDPDLIYAMHQIVREGGEIDIDQIIKFITKSSTDRLLGDAVRPINIFHEEILSGEYGEYFCIDLKLIKELNDTLGLTFADNLIFKVFSSIQQAIDAERDKFAIFRRGGTFIIAVRQDQQINQETRDQILCIDRVVMANDSGEILIPLGNSHSNHKYENTSDLIDMTEENWYRQIIEALLWNFDFISPISRIEPHESYGDFYLRTQVAIQPDNLIFAGEINGVDKLIRYFFHGKRAIERQARLIEVIDTIILEEFNLIANNPDNQAQYLAKINSLKNIKITLLKY